MCRPRRAGNEQQSTGLLHLHGFESCLHLQNQKTGPQAGLFNWCGQQDSNLHALAVEPKGDVTLVKVSISIVCLIQCRQFPRLSCEFLLL